jgi:hypothetical protein
MSEIDPGRDRRRPYQGQALVFHVRPGERGSGNMLTRSAMVLRVLDEDHVDILVIYGDFTTQVGKLLDFDIRLSVPRRTDQNSSNAWGFNEWDETRYRPGAERTVEPQPTGHLTWDDVKAMHAEIGVLRNRLAALEDAKGHK